MELTREELLRFAQQAAEAARKVVANDTERLRAILAEKHASSATGK